jgi:hypothetical protein
MKGESKMANCLIETNGYTTRELRCLVPYLYSRLEKTHDSVHAYTDAKELRRFATMLMNRYGDLKHCYLRRYPQCQNGFSLRMEELHYYREYARDIMDRIDYPLG